MQAMPGVEMVRGQGSHEPGRVQSMLRRSLDGQHDWGMERSAVHVQKGRIFRRRIIIIIIIIIS
jgi:hypothetical protein